RFSRDWSSDVCSSDLFKAITGVTPKQYAIAVRGKRLRHALAGSQSVTRALYDAGFGSSGSFYATATDDLGMPPGAYRDLGAGERSEERRVGEREQRWR